MKYIHQYFKVEQISKENNLIISKKNKFDNLQSRPAIFFDRDGVLIEDKHFISNPNQVQLLSGVKNLLDMAKKSFMATIVVTNQSGISRGYFNWEEYQEVTLKMLDIIGYPFNIDAIYACGAPPINNLSNWRKPNPYMLLEAKERFNLNLDKSIMIGDRLSDLKAGLNAGVKMVVHLLTGKGRSERSKVIKFFNLSENIVYYDSHFRMKINNKNQEILLIDNLLDFKVDFL